MCWYLKTKVLIIRWLYIFFCVPAFPWSNGHLKLFYWKDIWVKKTTKYYCNRDVRIWRKPPQSESIARYLLHTTALLSIAMSVFKEEREKKQQNGVTNIYPNFQISFRGEIIVRKEVTEVMVKERLCPWSYQ